MNRRNCVGSGALSPTSLSPMTTRSDSPSFPQQDVHERPRFGYLIGGWQTRAFVTLVEPVPSVLRMWAWSPRADQSRRTSIRPKYSWDRGRRASEYFLRPTSSSSITVGSGERLHAGCRQFGLSLQDLQPVPRAVARTVPSPEVVRPDARVHGGRRRSKGGASRRSAPHAGSIPPQPIPAGGSGNQ